MQSADFLFIVAAEVSVFLLVVCIFLVVQNRSLRQTVQKLKERVQKAVKELKLAKAAKAPATPAAKAPDLNAVIDVQIQLTRSHHQSLGSNQDIVLDIEPGTPLPHRTAALRFAVLNAEKEALAKKDAMAEEPNWKSLRERYEQLFSFHDDFPEEAGSGSSASAEELESLQSELANARKRVSNLEKFKNLYMDLEAQWETSSAEAKTHYDNLSQMAAKVEDPEAFEQALEGYNSAYDGMQAILDAAADDQANGAQNPSSDEVRHLRAVAADQHRIIGELQRKLKTASTESERAEVVDTLQDELQKQVRFVQESETCIQLLEDELNTTNKELDQLRARVGKVQSIKSEVLNLKKSNDELDIKVQTLVMENRKLQKQLQKAESSSTPTTAPKETLRLRKELAEMESRYNDLEEKFLDLKIQQ